MATIQPVGSDEVGELFARAVVNDDGSIDRTEFFRLSDPERVVRAVSGAIYGRQKLNFRVLDGTRADIEASHRLEVERLEAEVSRHRRERVEFARTVGAQVRAARAWAFVFGALAGLAVASAFAAVGAMLL